MEFNLDIKNILVLLVAGLNLAYGFFIYLRNKKSATNITFLLLTLSVGLWGLGMFAFRSSDSVHSAIFFSRILYFSASLIPFVFVYFILSFPEPVVSLSFWSKFIFPIPFLIVSFLSLAPSFLIKDIIFVAGGEHEIIFERSIHTLYALYVILCFSYAYVLLFKKYLNSKEKVLKLQIIYIIIGTLLSTLVGVITNLIGPYFGFFQFNWFGQVGVIVMISLISYSILKYNLFNIKLILVETSLILLNLFLLINVFLSSDVLNLSLSVVIFLSILLFSTLLLRGIYKDIRDREHIEALAKDMEKANERLKVMEQSKTEFVSIASHQLRTPLTVIKGYASMILEGTFGPLGTGPRMAMRNLADASARIVALVEDLLTVSRLEQGRLVLVLKPVNFTEYIRSILAEEESNVRVAGLELTYTVDENKEFYVSIDEKKFKQVVKHILDNAIKYTEPPGTIDFSLSDDQVAQKIRLSISDTGVGMSSPQIKELFERFNMKAAADEALKAPPTMSDKGSSAGSGTKAPGIGLYIAYEVVQAHKGNIHVHSAGTNKGTTFVIELPRTERPPELEKEE